MSERHSYHYYVYRTGMELTELKATAAGDIRCDMEADISRSLSVSFRKEEGFNPLKDEIAVYMDSERLGIFTVGTYGENTSVNGIDMSIEAYDRGYILQQSKIETRLYFETGDGYATIIGQLLDAHGFKFRLDPTDDILQSSREWDIGTSELDIINELLDEINYRHIWFDANGIAHMSRNADPDYKNITRHYDFWNVIDTPIKRDLQIETDLFDIPNVFIAICDNPDYEESWTAVAENVNPHSSVSIPNRGRRIVETFQVDNIASQEILQAFAVALMNAYSTYSENITMETAKMYPVDPGSTVWLEHPDVPDLENATGLYIETSWSMSLDQDGLMTHNLRRSRLT